MNISALNHGQQKKKKSVFFLTLSGGLADNRIQSMSGYSLAVDNNAVCDVRNNPTSSPAWFIDALNMFTKTSSVDLSYKWQHTLCHTLISAGS